MSFGRLPGCVARGVRPSYLPIPAPDADPLGVAGGSASMWRVGCSTGDKVETTIALTMSAASPPCRHELLGVEWLGKWKRSSAKYPADILPRPEETAFEEKILHHPAIHFFSELNKRRCIPLMVASRACPPGPRAAREHGHLSCRPRTPRRAGISSGSPPRSSSCRPTPPAPCAPARCAPTVSCSLSRRCKGRVRRGMGLIRR